ncbi:glycosyl hydrolase family 18 protein [Flammeovirga aprica]|uniref:chitinase n=1 Tax=Flammeovirga aprica JL-4 TaxID=694437 RepID=A0A7X9P1C3_9BACT|nr:glycosyl hydrolase family 18 protein [Flammeovirga aprica]NME67751.1 T9SS type A sorting domain-containing protein [Flammeovirga aprica JL-4]
MQSLTRKFRLGLYACLIGMLSFASAYAQIDSGSPYATSDHQKQVIGYVPNWDAWKGADFNIPKGALNHYNIDYSQYTILNFSFFGVAVDGSMHSGDLRNKQIYQESAIQSPADLLHPDKYSSHDQAMVLGFPQEFWGWDEVLSELGYEPHPDGGWKGWTRTATGETGGWPLTEYPTPGMIGIAHEYGVKVMASIGGWSMCKHFPEMAADPVKKARFLEDCRTLVEDYGFDGIDIDWEYPGPFAGMNFTGSEADYHNFTLLMQDIRDVIGPDRLLTAAFSAAPAKLQNLEWTELNKVMDYYNMMSYDFHGGWSGISGHNSPLYPYDGEEWGDFSWHTTFSYMRDELGVDTEKINMGMAFYGRGVVVEGTPGVNVPTIKKDVTFSVDGPVSSAADLNNWGATEGSPYYFQVKEALASGGWTRHWDSQAQVPYMTKEANGVSYFTSYDDEESIGLKSKYITDNNIGGVIIWTVFTDWNVGAETGKVGTYPLCPDTKPELVHVVNKVFAENAGPVNPAPVVALTLPSEAIEQTELAEVSFTFTASDDTGIASIAVLVNGNNAAYTTSGNTNTVSFLPSVYGEQSVEVTVTDDQGKSTIKTGTITITDPTVPNIDPTVSITSPLDGTKITSKTLDAIEIVLDAQDEDGTIASTLIAVDGQEFTASPASWMPSAFGTYTIAVTVTDNEGATATASVSITIEEETTGTIGCDAPEYQVYPTIYNSGDVVSYNGILYEAAVNNLYNVTPGSAEHWWKELGPCEVGPVAPSVSFNALASETVMVESFPHTIDLSTTSTDEDGTVVSTEVTVNGEVVTGATFDINAYGEYTVVATATDSDGLTATIQAVVTVTEPQPLAPEVTLALSASGTVEVETLPYTFTISSTSSDQDGTITSTEYTVNGDLVAEGDYSVTIFGTYTVTVTVTDNDGLTASDSKVITVSEKPDVVECPYPEWSSTEVYTGGDKVVYNGVIYSAKWWTQGNAPDGGDPWSDTGEVCGNGGIGDVVPTVTFIHPSGDTYTSLTTIDIAVEATDENGTVSNVVLTVDGMTVNASSTTFTPTAFGTYEITATATDDQGNVTTATKAVQFTTSAVNDINADGSINLTGPFAPAPTGQQRIIGYVPTWKGSPGDLDYTKVTHVNVSFLVYDTKVGGAYTDADFANGEYTAESLHVLDSLLPIIVPKAHSAGATVSIALGGAEDYGFLKVMEGYRSNPASIDAAADKLLAFVDKYNLDGIDLDMECFWQDPAIPGTSEQGGRTRGTDKWGGEVEQGAHPAAYGLTLLAKKLRAKRPSMLLSSAVFATPWYGNNYDADFVEYLDWLGLMTYDFTGSWSDSPIGPHSSLYDVDNSKYAKASADNPIYSVETSLEYWSGNWSTWQGSGHGVNKSKLTIGVPFYGYDLSLTKAEAGQGANGFYFIGYDEIVSLYPDAPTSYDPNDANQLNGYVGLDGRDIYFETPKGAAAKVNYARNNGLQGTIIWELTFDVDDPSISLLNAMNNAASSSTRQIAVNNPLEGELLEMTTYPNPFNTTASIQLNVHESGKMNLQLISLQGKVLNTIIKDVQVGQTVIDLDGASLTSGIYLVKVQVGEQQIVKRILKK